MIPRFTIDATRRVVQFSHAESASFHEWRVAMREATLHPEFAAGFGFIMDGRHQPGGPGSGKEIASVFSYLRDNEIVFGRVAVVVPDLATFGLTHAAQSAGGDDLHQKLRIVWSIHEAFAWVVDGVDPG